jgi:hypothetical protein
MGRPDLNFRIELARLLITFTIGLGLVKIFGLIGVAWGLLAGSITVGVIQGIVFFRSISFVKKINY